MKIALIWYFDKASIIFYNWRDGVRASMEELERRGHTVEYFLDKEMPPNDGTFDVLLPWCDSGSDVFAKMEVYKGAKKGLLLTTNPRFPENLRGLDVVYCESSIVQNEVRAYGLRAVKAFGTDTDFFKPKEVEKDIEYFYPATFSPWKCQDDLLELGDQLLCVGTVQPDGEEIYQKCLEAGVKIKKGYFPVKTIRDYYQRSKKVIIPSIHGSERTVIEAMSTDILPEVTKKNENRKTYSYIQEYLDSGMKSPRDFILKNYSHKVYADNILKGLL